MGKRDWRDVFGKAWRWGKGTVTLRASRDEADNELLNMQWWTSWWAGKPYESGRRSTLNGQVVFPSMRVGVGLGVHEKYSDRGNVAWNVCVPPLALYIDASSPRLARIADWLLAHDAETRVSVNGGRCFRLTLNEGMIMWQLWADEHGWSSKNPRWRDGSWTPLDTLLGRSEHFSDLITRVDVEVPMPEGTYMGVCELRCDSWIRPGLAWWPMVTTRAYITMAEGQGLPHPGKGENSYDCGEDATSGITCPASSVADGVGKLVASVLRSRERHGGKRWRPEKGPFGKRMVRGEQIDLNGPLVPGDGPELTIVGVDYAAGPDQTVVLPVGDISGMSAPGDIETETESLREFVGDGDQAPPGTTYTPT